ncbi:lytic transglycosylase domain-containing protein [Actinomadura terrae]|uniref:aggregation-promoting factor C-terminal-like domain-containing protein n=1 Tax=Actinomadura terrae TaxID=604353 RepID=UPI001FA6DD58|nr:lytic transglycosylase domain-containing protein [Actinomadura terrae]
MAGSPAAPSGPAGDTLGFQAVGPGGPGGPASPGGPAGPEGPDEISSGMPMPRAPKPAKAQRGSSGRSRTSSGGTGRRNGVRIAAVVAGAAVVVGGGAVAALALTGGDGGGSGDKATVASKPLADAPAPKVDPKVMEEKRREQALDRASRAVREEDGKGPSLQPKGEPIPTKTPEKDKGDGGGDGGGGGGPTGDPVPAGEAQAIARGMMGSFGSAFTKSGQFGCLVNLWNKESHWNTHAANPSGAYGIPQALPGSKMSSAGSDWQNSARTQIKWGLGYIKGRYGSPCAAWSHSQSVGWY